jgi:hypothetical protein
VAEAIGRNLWGFGAAVPPRMSVMNDSGTQKAPKRKREKEPAEKPVSLHPLEFEKALEGLLKVTPDKKKPR